MKKFNCWEIFRCGRQAGGANVQQLGLCPAATEGIANNANGGEYRGRICWSIAGTLCGGEIQATFAKQGNSCLMCPVHFLVSDEEGADFQEFPPGQGLGST